MSRLSSHGDGYTLNITMNALHTDTIAAPATPPGRSAVAMFRISGPSAFTVCDEILRARKPTAQYAARTLHRASVVDSADPSDTIDDVLVAVFHAPRSYTGEDVVEITCHGGEIPVRRILQLLREHGARLADPGEFTLRAYLNGKIDLSQAEAVADMIDARTDDAHRLALAQQSGLLSGEVSALRESTLTVLARVEATIDFPEDVGEFPTDWAALQLAGIADSLARLIATAGRGMLIRNGIGVALIGSPNAGKSSLLNALLRRDRAIVAPIAGTTRDVIEESVTLGGIVVRLSDTAGIRASNDLVESLGVERSRAAALQSDLILWVRDASAEKQARGEDAFRELIHRKPHLVVWTKADLAEQRYGVQEDGSVRVSALLRLGIDPLEGAIADSAFRSAGASGSGKLSACVGEPVVTHGRHLAALREAHEAVARSLETLGADLPLDFLSIELTTAFAALGLVTGETAPQDVVGEIFSKFCIGK